jgi:hypothetical protein
MFEKEVKFLDFGDFRLWKRFVEIGKGISKGVNSLMTNCFKHKKERKGAYRFF